ncbi:ABC-type polar amino acid transport system ATPase subunit [Bradyrhizobium sp. LM2.7]
MIDNQKQRVAIARALAMKPDVMPLTIENAEIQTNVSVHSWASNRADRASH